MRGFKFAEVVIIVISTMTLALLLFGIGSGLAFDAIVRVILVFYGFTTIVGMLYFVVDQYQIKNMNDFLTRKNIEHEEFEKETKLLRERQQALPIVQDNEPGEN